MIPLKPEQFCSLSRGPIDNTVCRVVQIFVDKSSNETCVRGNNLRGFDNGAATGADGSNKWLKRQHDGIVPRPEYLSVSVTVHIWIHTNAMIRATPLGARYTFG